MFIIMCVIAGHNADDIAETVIMNILRGDIARLRRCTAIATSSDDDGIPRCKPLKYTYEKEIVMYAYFKVIVTTDTHIAGDSRVYVQNIT